MTYYNARGVAMPESATEQARVVGTAAGNETVTAAAGNSSLSGEGGGDVLVGNTLDNRHFITNPADRVVEQVNGGIDTEIGYTSIKLAANVENLTVNGAYNYAIGNELPNLIVVDNTNHWVYGAGGDDVLVGATTDKTTFIVKAGEGSDVIYNWNGNSQLQLQGYAFTNAAQVRAAMSQQGADVVLNLGGGETLTFRDELLATFADRQFLMPLDTSKLGAVTFSDDFNSLQLYDPSLNTGVWRADFGGNLKDQWAYTIVTNGETQVYAQPGFQGRGEADLDINPFSVANGVLTITAQKVAADDAYAAWNRDYSSGMINTLGTFEQKYGYFEIRAEMPTATGTWPAFWMMTHPFISGVEADIFESLALTPNVDYRRAFGGTDTQYDNAYKLDPTGFHTYGMLWTPTTVTFYYDGIAVLTGQTPANWTEPMGMIVNMAVGGWGGNADASMFPATLKVDYIRAYALADGSTTVVHETPDAPVGTLRADGAATSGQAAVAMTFSDGSAVSTAHIAVYGAHPSTLPAGKTFVIWEDSGAVFGATSDGTTLGKGTALMAGTASQFTGTGTWLTTGKLVFGYMMPDDGGGKAAWAMVFDPVKLTFTRQELGPAVGDVRFVATAFGGFVASWDTADGHTMGRAYDEYAYGGDIPGWYGPARELAGDVTGVAANGDVIVTNAAGQQQLYDILNASAAPTTSAGATAGDDTMTGTAGDDYLHAGDGNDVISGGGGFDDTHGNAGNDTVSGGAGNDWVVGGKDQDLLNGDDGDDIVYGNLGNDWCDGGAGNDIVRGGQGDDTVLGQAGDDWLSGDRGNDTITGGAGADIFHGSQDAGIDRITDFSLAQGDRVQLDPGTTYTVSQVGADTVIDMGGSNQMILVGVQKATLTAGWIFGA